MKSFYPIVDIMSELELNYYYYYYYCCCCLSLDYVSHQLYS